MTHYYDIDDIISEEEVVPAVFQKSANRVGLMDPSAEDNIVEQGSKVELPFWLAQELHMRQAASVKAPACFNQKTRKEIQADAACVDLRSRSLYFYELGCKFVESIGDRTIGSFLLTAFRIRYKEVLTKAHTAASTVVPKFSALLTKEEANLHEAARASMAAFNKWRIGGPRFQRASVLGRKRPAS